MREFDMSCWKTADSRNLNGLGWRVASGKAREEKFDYEETCLQEIYIKIPN